MLQLLSCIWTNNLSSSLFTPYRSVNAIKKERLFISSQKPELSKCFLNILKYCTGFVSEVVTEKFDQNQNKFEISAKTSSQLMFAAIL